MRWTSEATADVGDEESFSPFSTAPSVERIASVYEQDELSSAALKEAVSDNTRYAQLLGWSAHIDRIAPLLGFTNTTPDMAAFTQAMAVWQSRNGLKADGVLGPVTWGVVQRALGIAAAPRPAASSQGAPGHVLIPNTKRGGVQLMSIPGEPWPDPGEWLVSQGPGANCTELQKQIVLRALHDDGIQEIPLGSNRGVRIDRYTRRSGMEPPQYWCAIWVGAVFADCGAVVPYGYPLTDNWLPFLEQTPSIGSAVLYGKRTATGMDSDHIGIVAMLTPLVLTVEGNRGYAGSTSNNGQAVDLAPMRRSGILGYFKPRRADGTT